MAIYGGRGDFLAAIQRLANSPPNERSNQMGHNIQIDAEMLDRLDDARQAQNHAAEYAERLYDEAFQLEQLAIFKRSLGKRVIDELNEDMPVPGDS